MDVDVRLVEDGGVVPRPDREYEINGVHLKSNDDGGVKTTVTGRGVVQVTPLVQGADEHVSAVSFDLERGKPSYRIEVPIDSQR